MSNIVYIRRGFVWGTDNTMSDGCSSKDGKGSSKDPPNTGKERNDDTDEVLFGAERHVVSLANGDVMFQKGSKQWNPETNEFHGGTMMCLWGGGYKPPAGSVPEQVFRGLSKVHCHYNEGKYCRCNLDKCDDGKGLWLYHKPSDNPFVYQDDENYRQVSLSDTEFYTDARLCISYMCECVDAQGNKSSHPYKALSEVPADTWILKQDLRSNDLRTKQDTEQTKHGPNSLMTEFLNFDPSKRKKSKASNSSGSDDDDPFGFAKIQGPINVGFYLTNTQTGLLDTIMEGLWHDTWNATVEDKQSSTKQQLCLGVILEIPFSDHTDEFNKFIEELCKRGILVVGLSNKDKNEKAEKPTFEDKIETKIQKKLKERQNKTVVSKEEKQVVNYASDDVLHIEACKKEIGRWDAKKNHTVYVEVLFLVEDMWVQDGSGTHNVPAWLTSEERKIWDAYKSKNNAHGCAGMGYTSWKGDDLPSITCGSSKSDAFTIFRLPDKEDQDSEEDQSVEETSASSLPWTAKELALAFKLDNPTNDPNTRVWPDFLAKTLQDGIWKSEKQYNHLFPSKKSKRVQTEAIFSLLGGDEGMTEQIRESYMSLENRNKLLLDINTDIFGKGKKRRRKTRKPKKEDIYEPELDLEEDSLEVKSKPRGQTPDSEKKEHLIAAYGNHQCGRDSPLLSEASSTSGDDEDGEESEEFEPVYVPHVVSQFQIINKALKNPNTAQVLTKDKGGKWKQQRAARLTSAIESVCFNTGVSEPTLRQSVKKILERSQAETKRHDRVKSIARAGATLKKSLTNLEEGLNPEFWKKKLGPDDRFAEAQQPFHDRFAKAQQKLVEAQKKRIHANRTQQMPWLLTARNTYNTFSQHNKLNWNHQRKAEDDTGTIPKRKAEPRADGEPSKSRRKLDKD